VITGRYDNQVIRPHNEVQGVWHVALQSCGCSRDAEDCGKCWQKLTSFTDCR